MNKRLGLSMLAIALVACTNGNQEVPLPEPSVEAQQATAQEADAPTLMQMTPEQILAVQVPAANSCNIETIDSASTAEGAVTIGSRDTTVDGWFFSEISSTPGVPAKLRITNEGGTAGWEQEISNWTQRADVSASKGVTGSANVGFSQELDLRSLPAGTYRLTIEFSEGGKQYLCDNGRAFVIK